MSYRNAVKRAGRQSYLETRSSPFTKKILARAHAARRLTTEILYVKTKPFLCFLNPTPANNSQVETENKPETFRPEFPASLTTPTSGDSSNSFLHQPAEVSSVRVYVPLKKQFRICSALCCLWRKLQLIDKLFLQCPGVASFKNIYIYFYKIWQMLLSKAQVVKCLKSFSVNIFWILVHQDLS